MSILNKIVAAMNSPETEKDWSKAREEARSYIVSAPWLEEVLLHHRQIADAFSSAKSASTVNARRNALEKLTKLWTGHALAEETAIYPVLSANGQQCHAKIAYAEKSCAKIQLGRIQRLDPMTREFDMELGHLECAIKHHMYQEESIWFLDFIEYTANVDHDEIAERYCDEFDRYMNGERVHTKSSQKSFSLASSSANHSSTSIHQPA